MKTLLIQNHLLKRFPSISRCFSIVDAHPLRGPLWKGPLDPTLSFRLFFLCYWVHFLQSSTIHRRWHLPLCRFECLRRWGRRRSREFNTIIVYRSPCLVIVSIRHGRRWVRVANRTSKLPVGIGIIAIFCFSHTSLMQLVKWAVQRARIRTLRHLVWSTCHGFIWLLVRMHGVRSLNGMRIVWHWLKSRMLSRSGVGVSLFSVCIGTEAIRIVSVVVATLPIYRPWAWSSIRRADWIGWAVVTASSRLGFPARLCG